MAAAVKQAFDLCVLLAVLVLILPNLQEANRPLLVAIGAIGAWRYGWWGLHFVRSGIYSRIVFPRVRRRADVLWQAGWRPGRVHFVMTTFREQPDITRDVLDSICSECLAMAVPARVFIATGDASDERVIEDYCARNRCANVDIVIIRQAASGKRAALATALRVLSRKGVSPDDVAVLMDGDSILCPGAVSRCAPLFPTNPALGAVTTDECVRVTAPRWIRTWLEMRFAQRRLAMQSHALSGKVLTLTGRFSMFRAEIVVDPEFIATVENDQLDHWLWGRFRFLSGDDKSTWFSLLRSGRQMLYVPDACVLTIENIAQGPLERVKQNLMRWSGNMLRNGSRALALGPRRCGFFIWWCVLDQRLAIWTALSGPVMALALSFAIGFHVLHAYLAWVLLSRTVVALVLRCYAGPFNWSLPLLLYASQVAGGAVKVYLLFRLSKQRWLNRGDQRSHAASGGVLRLQHAMAAFVTTFYLVLFVFAACLKTGVITFDRALTAAEAVVISASPAQLRTDTEPRP